MNTDKLYAIVALSLAFIAISMSVVLLAGLFNPQVDNKEVFAIMGPAFQTIVGAFVGLLSGKALSKGPQQ